MAALLTDCTYRTKKKLQFQYTTIIVHLKQLSNLKEKQLTAFRHA